MSDQLFICDHAKECPAKCEHNVPHKNLKNCWGCCENIEGFDGAQCIEIEEGE